MIALIVYFSCLFVACGAGAYAALSDLRGLTIPNICSVVIGVSYGLCFVVLYVLEIAAPLPSLFSALAGAGIFFAITLALFALGVLGAGDSKMGTACALWAGLGGLPVFLFFMTFFGGALALFSLALKKWKPFKTVPPEGWLARAQAGDNKIPYGVAIFTGMLASLVNLGYFEYETFSLFLRR